MKPLVLIRGGGDLATGVALRLHRAGFQVVITELPQPLAVRRTVAFAEAVYEGVWEVEKVRARLTETASALPAILAQGEIPLLVDPNAALLQEQAALEIEIGTLVDARLTKLPLIRLLPAAHPDSANSGKPRIAATLLEIGLGPGFNAGTNCHAVIETMRGHTLGRVYWQGSAMADTNLPEGDPRRVLRAPGDGVIHPHAEIAQRVEAGQIIAEVRSAAGQVRFVTSPFAGVLRGMIHPGLQVRSGLKIGDVDERNDPSLCYLVSDKSLSVGGGVLEAILTWANF
jgi:xanthine dehydrogenase accessory factor